VRRNEVRSRVSRSGLVWRAALALALLLAAAHAALDLTAQTGGDDADLERLTGEIRVLRTKLGRLREEKRDIEGDLRLIELELSIQTRELEVAERTEADLQRERAATERRIAELAPLVEKTRADLAGRMAVLYRMGRLSYLKIVFSLDETRNPFEAVGMLSYLVSRDARSLSDYRTASRLLEKEEERLAERTGRIRQTRAFAASRREAIEGSRTEKARLLAALEREQRSSTSQLARLEEKAERLERLLALLSSRSEGTAGPDGRVEEFKGALAWPVGGKLIESFGKHRSSRFATYTTSNGVKIGAPPGTEVRVVFDGTVLFSQWFKGYGNLIIIDHGERIFSLYGNTQIARVTAGEKVAAGQRVATVGFGEEGEQGFLYFEIRENNQPVDPALWLR
jgi:murein hydrolase activator